MVQIVLNEEQAQRVRQALGEPVQLCDSAGKVLAEIRLEYNKEFIAELKRRAAAPGPRYTGEQVHRRLERLQEVWDREGPFDQARMHALLDQFRAEDAS